MTKLTDSQSYPKQLDGYLRLLTTPTMFDMDLVGKNLRMNGVDALWFYPDPVDQSEELPVLFVPVGQKEQAHSVLASLDLTDFFSYHAE
ncbi:MAG: hypothetical protein WCW40_06420 [Bacteroidota bacterium]